VTTIAYSIADRSRVELAIYNVRGQLVRTLVEEDQAPNVYRVRWDGRSNGGSEVAGGVYFYRLIAGDFEATKKMVLIR
jgi:flagellar hook assembly protein FlgD